MTIVSPENWTIVSALPSRDSRRQYRLDVEKDGKCLILYVETLAGLAEGRQVQLEFDGTNLDRVHLLSGSGKVAALLWQRQPHDWSRQRRRAIHVSR